jgi:hypothetical protein
MRQKRQSIPTGNPFEADFSAPTAHEHAVYKSEGGELGSPGTPSGGRGWGGEKLGLHSRSVHPKSVDAGADSWSPRSPKGTKEMSAKPALLGLTPQPIWISPLRGSERGHGRRTSDRLIDRKPVDVINRVHDLVTELFKSNLSMK